MKKIVYLLAVLCMASMGFTQSYDYDRMVPEPARLPRPWATVALDEQVVSLPSGTPYHRLTFIGNGNLIHVEDVTIKFKQYSDDPTQVQITPIFSDNADIEFWANNPVQFFVESNVGETIVSVHGAEHEYTTFSLIKMVWKDPQGEIHKQYIGKTY